MQISPHVQATDLGQELVLHDNATGKVHVLNPTARIVWESLQQGLPVIDTVQRICLAFDGTSVDRVAADVERIIGDFMAAGLIT